MSPRPRTAPSVGRGWRAPAAAFAAAAVVATWAALAERPPRPVPLLVDCVLGWSLIALAWIDWQEMRLPDALTLPLLLLGLGVAGLSGREALLDGVLGALAGYAALRLVDAAYRLARGHDGLGQGDAKLLAAGGAWLGWAALPWVVLAAAGFGLAAVLLTRARGGTLTRHTAVPFGPALALAIWVVRLYGVPGG